MAAAQQTDRQGSHAQAKNNTAENLLHLDSEARSETRGRRGNIDINTRIAKLESGLGDLSSELDDINSSVEKSLDRLGKKDLDLSAKVSETWKQLGDLDKSYQQLTTQSTNIESAVKQLTTEIASVAASSTSRDAELNEQHEQLAGRVSELVSESREISARLTRSIEDNTRALKKVEQQLVADIESLAKQTSDVTGRVDRAETEIENSKARMLKMQAVDEALDMRAQKLEKTTSELTDRSHQFEQSIDALEKRTQKLEDVVHEHSLLIDDVEVNVAHQARTLLALAHLERKHVKALSSAIALVIVTIIGITLYQSSTWQNDAVEVSQRIAGMQQQNNELSREIGSLNEQLTGMDDQVRSLGGRVDYISPFSSFGSDSTIHGPQWLASQPAVNVTIRIATVTDRKEMYEIASRYNHYFSDELSYYTLSSAGAETYVLLYGSFADAREASAAMWRMPYRIQHQQLQVQHIGSIQNVINRT